MNLYSHKDSNIRKTWLLLTLFLVFIVGLGWIFSRVYNSPEILYFAVILSLFMNGLSYWFSDRIALSISGAKSVKREENLYLYRIVENLCITAGLPLPRLYVIESNQINAFATGRNPKNAAIAVTRGALEKLQNEELEGVLAHELSHIGNRDILVMTVVVVLSGVIAMLADWFLRISFWGGDRDGDNRGGALILLIGLIAAILAPIAATLIQLSVSRKREFLADASGALLTRYPNGLANALEKISHDNVPMRHAHNATAHLFISNPFKIDAKRSALRSERKGGHNVSWITKLFLTHPPVEERIKILRDMHI